MEVTGPFTWPPRCTACRDICNSPSTIPGPFTGTTEGEYLQWANQLYSQYQENEQKTKKIIHRFNKLEEKWQEAVTAHGSHLAYYKSLWDKAKRLEELEFLHERTKSRIKYWRIKALDNRKRFRTQLNVTHHWQDKCRKKASLELKCDYWKKRVKKLQDKLEIIEREKRLRTLRSWKE